LATCAIPLRMKWLVAEGIGSDVLGDVYVEGGNLVANMDRVHAGKIIDKRQATPVGDLAREALLKILLSGRLFRKEVEKSRECFTTAQIWHGLLAAETCYSGDFEQWLAARVAELGLESGEDLQLVSGGDFVFPSLPTSASEFLEKKYPLNFAAEEDRYGATYELGKRRVTVEHLSGRRKEPPSNFYLPSFPGLSVIMVHRGRRLILRN